MNNEVLEFINKRFKNVSDWINGNCYYFAIILKDRFPEGQIYYDVINGHFVFEYNDKFYDHAGVVNSYNCLVKWNEFDMYDSLQKERIIRDCIM